MAAGAALAVGHTAAAIQASGVGAVGGSSTDISGPEFFINTNAGTCSQHTETGALVLATDEAVLLTTVYLCSMQ